MIYLGHFSFHVDRMSDPMSDLTAGTFTGVVDAKNINAAIKQLRLLVRAMPKEKGLGDMLAGVAEIYMDSCSEIKQVPRRGFIPFFSLHTDSDEPGGITTANRGVTKAQATAFMYGNEKTDSPTPFVRFKRATAGKRVGGTLPRAQPNKGLSVV